MGVKLNPPITDTQSPAQCDKTKITIPFRMNKSVSTVDFDKMSLMVKTTSSSTVLFSCTTTNSPVLKNGYYEISFTINDSDQNKLTEGQYYKAQIAYVGTDDVTGFYSNATVFKFTKEPTVTIKNLDTEQNNIHFYEYNGVYENEDQSEKVYSYEFNLYDSLNKLIASSGEQLHNSSFDVSRNSSVDTWTTRHGLNNGIYSIEYKIKTINGIEKCSPRYKLVDNQTSELDLSKYWNLLVENNFDSGCINLYLQSKIFNEDNKDKKVSLAGGQFVLLRVASDENYEYWNEVTRFNLLGENTIEQFLFYKDYTVAQGVTYKYAIQSYNNQNMYSKRLVSDFIIADFEDMFLSDGDRQLRVRFNPKVTSMKNTILESKTDTIGGQYPFFFRNGRVNYKEFPISGLITMLMDENQEFIQGLQIQPSFRNSTPSKDITINTNTGTALSSQNFKQERDFKYEVLEWLTNGKPKQFRSPGEGNYLIRLMNTSLAPNDQLSRMIHTFNCTAYEIDTYNFENLYKYNMLFNPLKDSQFMKYTIESSSNTVTDIAASEVKILAEPGTEFNYTIEDEEDVLKGIIDYTGEYLLSLQDHYDKKITSVTLTDASQKADIVYSTEEEIEPQYIDTLNSVNVELVELKNTITGKDESILPELMTEQENRLNALGTIEELKVVTKPIVTQEQYDKLKEEHADGWDDWENNEKYKYIIQKSENEFELQDTNKTVSSIDTTIQLNEIQEAIDLAQAQYKMDQLKDCLVITAKKNELYLKQVNNIDKLLLGNGLMISKISFMKLKKEYNDTIKAIAKDEEALNDYIKGLEQAMIVIEKEEVSHDVTI